MSDACWEKPMHTEERRDNLGPIDEVKDNLNAATSLDVVQVMDYLSHYGYLSQSVMSMGPALATHNIVEALHEFQDMAGLPRTGSLDEATLAKMQQPRCAFPDVLRSCDGTVFQRMVAEARWRKTSLTYFIGAYVNGIPNALQEEDISIAFSDWITAANGGLVKIERTQTQQQADLVILTGSGRGQGFDGPSGTLAYAFIPPGDDRQLIMRFDLSETWVRSGNSGIHFRNVFCHEAGHLLGLEHSRVPTSLMAPFYSPNVRSPVNNDDVSRIRALYPSLGPTPLPPPLPPPNPPRDWKPLHEPFTMGVSELAICTRQATVSAT